MALPAGALIASGKTVQVEGILDADTNSGTIKLPTRTAATENEICITSGGKLQYRDGGANYTLAGQADQVALTWGHTSFMGRILVAVDGGAAAFTDANTSETSDTDGANAGCRVDDGQRRDVYFQIDVPTELDVTAACDLYVIYRPGTGAANGNIEIEAVAMAHASGEAPGSGGQAYSASSIFATPTTATLRTLVFTGFFGANTLAVRDMIRGCIFRDARAGNADDTSTNSVNIETIYVVGKRTLS